MPSSPESTTSGRTLSRSTGRLVEPSCPMARLKAGRRRASNPSARRIQFGQEILLTPVAATSVPFPKPQGGVLMKEPAAGTGASTLTRFTVSKSKAPGERQCVWSTHPGNS